MVQQLAKVSYCLAHLINIHLQMVLRYEFYHGNQPLSVENKTFHAIFIQLVILKTERT